MSINKSGNESKYNNFNFVLGFTLAEVLITLGIIGIVAAMTIPTLIKNTQDLELKTAYKKAYADLNNVFVQASSLNEFPERTACYDANFSNFLDTTLKEKFKVEKVCAAANLYNCWTQGDKVFSNSRPAVGFSKSFIDTSGRVWAEFDNSRGIYLLDVNSGKSPNKFGKDRWIFAFYNQGSATDCAITPSKPIQIRPYVSTDIFIENDWCNYPPCYYKSWLYDN